MTTKKEIPVLSTIKRHPFLLFVLIFVSLFPYMVKDQYLQRMMVEIFFIGAMASAWNILGGYAEQTSWAHASFVAIGAYTSFILLMKFNLTPFLGVLLAIGISVLISLVIGLPTFKLRGTFFSIATIAWGTIVRQILLLPQMDPVTGGANGLVIPASGFNIMTLSFTSETPFYYIALALLAITVFIVHRIERSRLGFYLRAIKEDQDAAESLGIKSHRQKLIALIISAVIMTILGMFYSFKIRYIDPQSVASHDLAVRIGITAIIGGLGSKWGPIIGAFVTIPVLEAAQYFFGSFGGGGLGFAIYGAMMVIIVLFEKGGLIAVWQKISSSVSGRFSSLKSRKTNHGNR